MTKLTEGNTRGSMCTKVHKGEVKRPIGPPPSGKAPVKNDKWISVDEALPVIPEGRYGVQVIVAMFDATYEEINPGHGYDVIQYSYHKTTGRDGKKHMGYEWCELDADFMEFGSDGYAYPSSDPITHWMYLPDPPKK